MNPAGALLGGALSGLNSGSGPALSDAYAGGSGVTVGGLTVNKSKLSDLIIAGCVGGLLVWLVK